MRHATETSNCPEPYSNLTAFMKMNTRIFLLLSFLLLSYFPFAQSNQPGAGETYAIVVGISKYRFIKPLSYADRDADLLAELLRSGAGGKIKPENLFLLKNDSANGGNFWSALQRICNKQLNKGDRVYIYFAGHGDAVKGLNEYYLLLSDCQPANDGNNYLLSFAAIDMYHLKNRIGLLTGKGVEVILILDACRTNELAGGYASQVFSTSVVQAKVGDIAMLATGPGQVSIEDASFGNGHGLFTYNLVDALSGRADAEEPGDNDKKISLDELQRWVTRSVTMMSQKFRVQQSPVFCCDDKYKSTIGFVDSSFRLAWNRLKDLNNNNASRIDAGIKTQRGNEGTADTSLLALYNTFNEARKENKLWGEGSADSYYEQMKEHFPNHPITEDAKYILASDFINFAQQKINLYLEGKDLLSLESLGEKNDSSVAPGFLSDEYERLQKTVSEKWTIAARMIEKAGRLLSTNKDSALFYQLKPKIGFLLARGYITGEKESNLNYAQALKYSQEAYQSDSNAAYTAECLGLVYAWRHSFNRGMWSPGESEYELGSVVRLSDTAMNYFKKAIRLAPKWVSPYRSIALKIYGQLWDDSALVYLHRAELLNPDDATTYIMIGDIYRQRNPDSAMFFFRKALTLSGRSSHAMIYRKMARVFLDGGFMRNSPTFKPDSVMAYSKLALAAASNGLNDPVKYAEMQRDVYMGIANAYSMQEKHDSALLYYFKTIKLFPGYEWPNRQIIWYFLNRNRSDSVFRYAKKFLEASPENAFALQEIAKYYENKKGFTDSAILYYQRTLRVTREKDFPREKLGYLLMKLDKNDTRPLDYFSQTLKDWPSGWRSYFNFACYYANRGETGRAIENLEKMLALGMKNKKLLFTDPYISTLQNEDAFKKLMARYFPE